MRSEALLIAALLLAGCGGDSDAPPQKKEQQKAPPPASRGDAAALGTDTVTLPRPGSQRALIYTWRGRFPGTLQDDVEWILSSDEYVKTEDMANTWRVVYCTKDGKQFLEIAACEYVSNEAAAQTYDNFLSKVEKPAPMAAPEGCEKATAATLGSHALAGVLSTRYLFIFKRAAAPSIGEDVVKTFVKACFTEPKGD
jgi:hypothetical protein